MDFGTVFDGGFGGNGRDEKMAEEYYCTPGSMTSLRIKKNRR